MSSIIVCNATFSRVSLQLVAVVIFSLVPVALPRQLPCSSRAHRDRVSHPPSTNEERSLLCTSPRGGGAPRSAILLKNRCEVECSITPFPEIQHNVPCIPHAVSGETSAVRGPEDEEAVTNETICSQEPPRLYINCIPRLVHVSL
ncbi:uncharacterized protein LOC143921434 [Arctopsyche grandis]|uniref:uncharacterized protein LOC143921434 n=1 Tax=Arctopsyche grandis TaxID=121162 RepID=UPI00406D7711